MSLAGPNCWVPMLAKFVTALAASTTFRTMIGADELTAEAIVLGSIFGNRVTHSKDGRVWTVDERNELRHYGAVFDDPNAPYGKHLDAATNGCYRPHGTTIVYLARLVPDAELIPDNTGRLNTTDEHDEAWRGIVGSVPVEMIDWMIENGGPRILGFEVGDVVTTPSKKSRNQGMWQGADISFPWREG